MKQIKFRSFHPDDSGAVTELQNSCAERDQDTGKFETGFWLSPGFQGGKNIILAQDSKGDIVGYAATTSAYYANTLEARVYWVDLRTDPELDPELAIKDALLDRIIQRGYGIKMEEKRERAAMGATYFSQGQASINYLKSRGFNHFETMLAMEINLSIPVRTVSYQQVVSIKPWRMEARSDKKAYLEAIELAFGYPLGRLDLLEHFTESELWQGGTTFTAFSRGDIIASVMALSNGLLDYVFVIPQWRGKGIAKALVIEALKFLEGNGHNRAWLEVLSHNHAATGLYRSLGFETFKEEISLGYLLT